MLQIQSKLICCFCCYCWVTKSCLTLCNPMDCSQIGSSMHGIFQARLLEWVAISSSRWSSWPRDQTCISCNGRQNLYHWATHRICQLGFLYTWTSVLETFCIHLKSTQHNSCSFHPSFRIAPHSNQKKSWPNISHALSSPKSGWVPRKKGDRKRRVIEGSPFIMQKDIKQSAKDME